jgi:hypothetical protein
MALRAHHGAAQRRGDEVAVRSQGMAGVVIGGALRRSTRATAMATGHAAEAGAAQAALPAAAAAAANEERAASGGAAVRKRRLEPARQPGLLNGPDLTAGARLERQAPRGHRAPQDPQWHLARAAPGRRAVAAGLGRSQRARERQALGVHGAGDGRGLPAGVHRAAPPRPGRCGDTFDELNDQWGQSGLATQDSTRCEPVARACALV